MLGVLLPLARGGALGLIALRVEIVGVEAGLVQLVGPVVEPGSDPRGRLHLAPLVEELDLRRGGRIPAEQSGEEPREPSPRERSRRSGNRPCDAGGHRLLSERRDSATGGRRCELHAGVYIERSS